MPIYRFILRPLDRIFFGEERSPFKEEYYKLSRLFPQQTTALGLLRYEILRRTDLLENNTGKPIRIKGNPNQNPNIDLFIGANSFDGTQTKFGLIKRISPVQIYDTIRKKDFFLKRKIGELIAADFNPTTVKVSFGEVELPKKNAYLSGYKAKDYAHLAEVLADLQGEEIPLFQDKEVKLLKGVFYKETRTGITKNYKGVSKDNSYFKMETLRMNSAYSYSFKAELNVCRQIDNWEGESYVRFGGDSCTYRMTVEKATDWQDNKGEGNCFLLLSDAFVDASIFQHCKLVIANTLHFRNLKTSTKDDYFSKRPIYKWYGAKNEWDGYEGRVLLKKGSWLVAEENQASVIKSILQKNNPFTNIGYNHFQQFINLL